MRTATKLRVGRMSLTLLIGGWAVSAAFAQGEVGTATINGVQNGSLYDYTITLSNTGAVPIATFWFAWIPGGFFLPSTPTSQTAPSGWTASVMGSYSIEYTAGSSADALAAGSSLNYYFTSPDTPAALAGYSPHNSLYRVGTSYLYKGAAFGDSGYQFVVQSVPEPTAMSLLAAGFVALVACPRRQAQLD